MKTICICGGGSLGHVCAGVFVSKGYKVSILTGHPEKWQKDISVVDPDGKVFQGALSNVTSEPSEVIADADIVLLCLPGYLIEKQLLEIRSYLLPSTIVGSIVSSTGFFFIAHKVLPKTLGLFGFQRVPFIARVNEYGRTASLLGYKSLLKVAVENINDQNGLIDELSEVLMTPIELLNNYYEASLTNSNPILHTGRLFTLWRSPETHLPMKHCIRFYADWTDEASEILLAMDDEFGELLNKLRVSRKVVPTLLDYYDCQDAKDLTRKIRSIPAFLPILAPMVETSEGWIPDFNSRYFTEDFPFGLKFIRDLAREYGISTPTIDKVYEWGINMIAN